MKKLIVMLFIYVLCGQLYLMCNEKTQPKVVLTTRDNSKIELINVGLINEKDSNVFYTDAKWHKKEIKYWFRHGLYLESMNWNDISLINFYPNRNERTKMGDWVINNPGEKFIKVTYLNKKNDFGIIPLRKGYFPQKKDKQFSITGTLYLHGVSKILGKKATYEIQVSQIERIERIDNKNFRVISEGKVQTIVSPEFWLSYSDNHGTEVFEKIYENEILFQVKNSEVNINFGEIKSINLNMKKENEVEITDTIVLKNGHNTEGIIMNWQIKLFGKCIKHNRIVFAIMERYSDRDLRHWVKKIEFK